MPLQCQGTEKTYLFLSLGVVSFEDVGDHDHPPLSVFFLTSFTSGMPVNFAKLFIVQQGYVSSLQRDIKQTKPDARQHILCNINIYYV